MTNPSFPCFCFLVSVQIFHSTIMQGGPIMANQAGKLYVLTSLQTFNFHCSRQQLPVLCFYHLPVTQEYVLHVVQAEAPETRARRISGS